MFPVPALIAGAWTVLSPDMRGALVQRFEDAGLPESHLSIGRVRVLPLRFWDGWVLCDLELAGDEGRPASVSLVYGPDGFTRLEPGEVTFQKHNKLHGIDLGGAAACLQYLSLFCLYGLQRGVPHHLLTQDLPFDLIATGGPGDGIQRRDIPPVVTMQTPPPSPLDQVRAPELARVEAEVFRGGALCRYDFRLARDGEVTVRTEQLLHGKVALVPDLSVDGAVWTVTAQRGARKA